MTTIGTRISISDYFYLNVYEMTPGRGGNKRISRFTTYSQNGSIKKDPSKKNERVGLGRRAECQ